MASGGKRPGAGRKSVQSDGRAWIRSIVDDPIRREAFRECLDRTLTGEDAGEGVAAFLRAFEHGFGRPPQALDVKVGNGDGPLEFRILDVTGAAFAFGGGDLPTRSLPLPTGVTE